MKSDGTKAMKNKENTDAYFFSRPEENGRIKEYTASDKTKRVAKSFDWQEHQEELIECHDDDGFKPLSF